MKRKEYIVPSVEEVELLNQSILATSVRSDDDTGITYGGSSSKNNINEADVNKATVWDDVW